ncbi:outer membrane protein transport protein [Sulfurimonas sp. SAG-AH-194-L11]|nr:outer membrane protein transport protein [Sulfurimonas sp. SAG-AH-194-L11]MDF1877219.1 outer membrane protein transport protein [Sulfurimonas sp. SAG-AH-194-L11]
MKTNLLKITTLSVLASSVLMASGYKIPETSTNSVALSGANVAHVSSADAAYDNPANMIFMDDKNHLEVDLMYVGLSATQYDGNVNGAGPYSLTSQEQTFIIPSVHYVSPKLGENDVRIGLSIVVPGGLTREWLEQPAQSVAEEFTLQIIEVNPTVAYKLTKNLAFAVGLRFVHSSGVVKSSGQISRDMNGNSNDVGYNFAFAYKPTSEIDLAITYRSKVDLGQEGNAKLFVGDAKVYDGGAAVSVPLPATLTVALAYTFSTKTTVEFMYDKTYWSGYENLTFTYTSPISNILQPFFATPIAKNWEDTEAFRLGITQKLEDMTLMAGAVIDHSPTPEATLNFESPGSDSLSFSLGGRYKLNDTLDIGLSALYSMKEDRKVSGSVNVNGIDGEFTNSNALLISAGVGYRF